MKQSFPLILLGLLLLQCTSRSAGIVPNPGTLLSRSTHIKTGTHYLPADSAGQSAAIVVEGEDIVIDLQHALIIGDTFPTHPDNFRGVAIHIRSGKNITLKNARIKGYEIGILAENIDQLKLENIDLSYNHRQRLGSKPDRLDPGDRLDIQHCSVEEWRHKGAAILLKNCKGPEVLDCKVTNGQHALLLENCEEGLIANNRFTFNSGVGIGLFQSVSNRIMHNRLDWNVRSYSSGKYAAGHESTGIMLTTQCNGNTIAYNSATHCGNGLSIWPGQQTLDTGAGGSNENLIFANDFSYATKHGIEVTFGRNKIINNRMEGCHFGIWAGFSYNSVFAGNYFRKNRCGLAIEHGQDNFVDRNIFEGDQVGLWTWERRSRPDLGYYQERDPRSRDYLVVNNIFTEVDTPLKIMQTERISASGNSFSAFNTLLHNNRAVEIVENDIYTDRPPYRYLPQNQWHKDTVFIVPPRSSVQMTQYAPTPIESGRNTLLPPEHPHGREQIIMTEWGPYDFQYPICRLKDSSANGVLTFEVLGPPGIWKLNQRTGISQISNESGTVPSTFTASYESVETYDIRLTFSYVGASITDVYGQQFPAEQPYAFSYARYHKPLSWAMAYFAYDDRNHPVNQPEEYTQLLRRTPRIRQRNPHLGYLWADRPASRVPADRFVSVSETEATFQPGQYEVELSYDDGIRFYVDDQLVYEDWKSRAEAARALVELPLSDTHRFRVEHFDESGPAMLLFDIRPRQEINL